MDRGLIELLRYAAWANRTLLDACRPVSSEQLHAAVPPTSESIAELLVHIAGAEENVAHMVRGDAFESGLNRDTPWPGIDEVARLMADTSARLIVAAETLDPDGEVDLRHHGATHRYSCRFLLLTVIEHGIRHRAEVVLMLTTLGGPSPDLDGWAYGRTAGHGRVVS